MSKKQNAAKTNSVARRLAPRWWVWLAIAIVSSVAVLALLAWMLVPGLRAAITQQVSSGSESFAIGTVAQVTPDAGWVVQQVADDEVRLISPDRGLSVMLTAHMNEHNDSLPGNDSLLRNEILANGARFTYVASETQIVGELQLIADRHSSDSQGPDVESSDAQGSTPVQVIASIDAPADAGLAVSKGEAPATPPTIDVYRATLAELLLQIG